MHKSTWITAWRVSLHSHMKDLSEGRVESGGLVHNAPPEWMSNRGAGPNIPALIDRTHPDSARRPTAWPLKLAKTMIDLPCGNSEHIACMAVLWEWRRQKSPLAFCARFFRLQECATGQQPCLLGSRDPTSLAHQVNHQRHLTTPLSSQRASL